MVALAAALLGVAAAVLYYQQELTLSHYDAKGHLVVARRIFDSLRPGWWQIGAVWLPLPHLLNMLPVQIDWLYRTGLSAVAMSIASFSVTATTIWWWIRRGDRVARRRRGRHAGLRHSARCPVSAVDADDGAAADGVHDARRRADLAVGDRGDGRPRSGGRECGASTREMRRGK